MELKCKKIFDALLENYLHYLNETYNIIHYIVEKDVYEIHFNKDCNISYICDGRKYKRYVYNSYGGLSYIHHGVFGRGHSLEQFYENYQYKFYMTFNHIGEYVELKIYGENGLCEEIINSDGSVVYKYNKNGDLVSKNINGIFYHTDSMLPFDIEMDEVLKSKIW